MLIDDFLAPKVLIVSGKGGVGKTTVAAALALVAARRSRKVCIAEVDRKGALPRLLGGGMLGYDPKELLPGIWGLNIAPDKALEEYLEVQYHMRRISRVLTHSHFIDYVTTAAPGLKDILVLGKVWYLEQGRPAGGTRHNFDTIALDAPAAGHMRTFLAAPAGLSDAVRVGPIRRQSDWILGMLTDPIRARIHLVTLAEEMPVAETLETAHTIRSELRMHQGVTFVNAVYPDLFARSEERIMRDFAANESPEGLLGAAAAAGLKLDEVDLGDLLGWARFLGARRAVQRRHLKSLRADLDGAVVELPFLFSAGFALPDVETLADAIEERVEKL